MRLALGCAQLGMPYGVGNSVGQPDQQNVMDMLKTAFAGGIRTFDTAPAYGDSERVLGRCLDALESQGMLLDDVAIATKTLPDLTAGACRRALADFLESQRRLGAGRIRYLLLHREEALGWLDGDLGSVLQTIAEAHGVAIGVSVYTVGAAAAALDREDIGCLQLPASVMDRRFYEAGILERATARGVRVFIRSVFLQGLLLQNPADISDRLAFARPWVARFAEIVARYGLDPVTLCLAVVGQMAPQAQVLFGAETSGQILDTLEKARQTAPEEALDLCRKTFADVPERLVNPSLWP